MHKNLSKISVAMAVMAAMSAARADQSADSAQDSDSLQEVVVTAEKRTESLQNVPISVSALDSKALEQMNIQSFSDYASSLPTVSFQNNQPGGAQVFMRGIGSSGAAASGSDPTVGMYLDEQPITTNTGSIDMHMYDIARVEVLPGPQGTLYGASSESGTIRVITNKPDPTAFAAGYNAQLNTVHNGTAGGIFEGFVNVPLTDYAAVRLVGWYERDSGYIDNVHQQIGLDNGYTLDNANLVEKHYNPTTVEGARLAGKINVNDNWTVSPTLITQRTHWDGIFAQEDWKGTAPGTPIPSDLAVAAFGPQVSDDNWVDAALTVQGKIGNFDVTYAGSYLNRNEHTSGEYTDYTLSYQQYESLWPENPNMLEQNSDAFIMYSNELRVTSPVEEPLRFVAGLYQNHQQHHFVTDQFIPGVDPAYWVGAGTPQQWTDTWWLTDQQRVDRDYAVFGEGSWDITSKLTLTAGIRRFWYDNTLDGFFGFSSATDAAFGPGVPGEAICFSGPILDAPCENVNAKSSGKGWTPKYNLAYKIDEDALVYATFSKGFRPGGINRLAILPPYGADFLENYEVGWKTSWFENHLRFNGAVYYEQWKNFQFGFPGPYLSEVIANAGGADVKGLELNVEAVPISGLTLSLGSAYNNAKLTENYCGTFNADGAPISSNPCLNTAGTVIPALAPIGTRLPYTPLVKFNATARYTFPLLGQTGFVEADEVYQTAVSPALKVSDSTQLGEQPAYGLTNMFIGVDRGSWSAELLVKNVFDRRAILSTYAEAGSAEGLATYSTVATPRLIGVQFSQKF